MRLFQSRYVRGGLIFVLFAILIAAGLLAYRNHQETAREDALKQVFAALQQYAEASAGNYYPLRSAEPGVFLPDFDEWEKLAPDKAAFQRAKEILTRERERPLCYLGYSFNKETFALQILDRIQSDAKSFRGGGPVEGFDRVHLGSPEVDELHPLRRGVERTILWDFVFRGNTPHEGELEERIPILWEMPEGEQDRVLVLNLDGYVRKRKYPDEFPMSSLFINRLRGLMGLPQDPGFRDDAPIIPILREIMSAWDHQQTGWSASIRHFDVEPSVTVGEYKGYRIVVPEANMVLFPGNGEPPQFDAASFFHGTDSNVWDRRGHDPGQCVGSGSGYHWYGSVTYPMQLLLREKFALTGGDSLYPVAVAYCWRHHRGVALSALTYANRTASEATSKDPESLPNYVQIYLEQRREQERPVDDSIVDAAKVLDSVFWEGYGDFRHPNPEVQKEAARRLLVESEFDPEATTTLAMLFVLRFRYRSWRDELTEEGLELLRKLPRDVVLRVVEDMASRIQQPDEAEACRRVLEELNRVPADRQVQAR